MKHTNRPRSEKKMSNDELEQLKGVIDTLKATPLPNLSNKTRRAIAQIPGGKSKAPFITFVSLGSAFAVFLVLVVAAQFALPGSPLYGIKRGTEYVRALIQPTYKENLVEVRKQELETLEKEQASETLIEEAATEYEKAYEKSDRSTHTEPESDSRHQEDADSDRTERRNWRNRDDENSRDVKGDSTQRSNNTNDDWRINSWSWR